MSLPSAHQVTAMYLYGQSDPPNNFLDNDLSLSRASSTIVVNTDEFLNHETGAGRFIVASNSAMISRFFETASGDFSSGVFDSFKNASTGEVLMTKAELNSVYNLEYYGILVDNKWVYDGFDDYASRTYIYGNIEFKISNDAVFKIDASGNLSIENFSMIYSSGGDFDWEGGDGVTNVGNIFLKAAIDPSGIGETVNFDFSEPSSYTYSQSNYESDIQRVNEFHQVISPLSISQAMGDIIRDLYDQETISTQYDGKLIMYGNDGADTISGYITVDGTNVSDSSAPNVLHNLTHNGLAYVSGAGDDLVSGTSGNDIFLDGFGSDTYAGSGGFDVIIYTSSESPVSVDIDEGLLRSGDDTDHMASIEGILASVGNDTISSTNATRRLLAGGGGDDEINLNLSVGSDPIMVWGGAGADTINISVNTAASDPEGAAVGILVVNVDNISEQNFHNLTYDMLGMGDDFEWSEIDVVLINPDSADRVNLTDNVGTQQLGAQTLTREQWYYPGTGANGEEIPPQLYYTTSFTGYGGSFEGHEGWIEADEWAIQMYGPMSDYRQSFLSGYDGPVYGPADTLVQTWVTEYRNSDGTFLLADTSTDYYAEFTEIFGDFGVGGSGSDGEIDTEYDLSGADAVSDWVGNAREHYFYGFTTDLGEEMDPITAPTGWFMVGGHLSGDSVVLGDTSGGGVIHVQIPDTGDMVMV